MSLSCWPRPGEASAPFLGSSLCMSSGSAGSWRELNLMNQRKIPTWLITSRVPLARSVGSVEPDDGRRMFGPNTVARLFCPILFCSWCSLSLYRRKKCARLWSWTEKQLRPKHWVKRYFSHSRNPKKKKKVLWVLKNSGLVQNHLLNWFEIVNSE